MNFWLGLSSPGAAPPVAAAAERPMAGLWRGAWAGRPPWAGAPAGAAGVIVIYSSFAFFLLAGPVVAAVAGALVGRWALPMVLVFGTAALVVSVLTAAPGSGEDQRVLVGLFVGVLGLLAVIGAVLGPAWRKRADSKRVPAVPSEIPEPTT